MADAGYGGSPPPPLPGDAPPPLPPPPPGDAPPPPLPAADGAVALPPPPAAPKGGGALVVLGPPDSYKPGALYGIRDEDMDPSRLRAVEVHERYASGALITNADIVKRLAMAPLGPPTGRFSKPRGRKIAGADSSSEDEAPEEPPGSPAPEFFMASGPGLAGGAAGVRAAVTITARDANRRRVRDGGQGAEVVVAVRRAGLGAGDAAPILAAVTDRGDGSYVAVYEVPERGNYNVHIEVEGAEIDGSPYPVFFSAYDPNSAAAAAAETASYLAAVEQAGGGAGAGGAGAAAAAGGGGAAAPKLIGSALGSNPTAGTAAPASVAAAAAAAAAASVAIPGMPAGVNTAAHAAAVAAAQASSSAIPAALQAKAKELSVSKAGVERFAQCVVVFKFPGMQINADALKTIMGVTGTVKNAEVHQVGGEWLGFVEFATAEEARGALGLTGTLVGDMAMQVVLAPPVTMQDLAASNPLLALQMETIQKAQAAMVQQQALLAAMRAQIGAVGDGGGKGGSRRRSRSRSRSHSRGREMPAWLTARQGGGGGGKGRRGGGGRERSPPPRAIPRRRTPSPPPRRRSRSPLRRRRTPSPSPPRGHRGRGEPRFQELSRGGDGDRRRSRSRERGRRDRSRSRDRRRDRSRSRDRRRSRSRDRRGGDGERHHKHSHKSKHKHKEKEKEKDRERRRSGSGGGGGDREAAKGNGAAAANGDGSPAAAANGGGAAAAAAGTPRGSGSPGRGAAMEVDGN